jgi:hypothetical protein
VSIEQLYPPAVQRVLMADTQGLPMCVFVGEHKATLEDKVIAANLAHLLHGVLLIDTDVL